MNPTTITQYRAELTFNDNSTCTLTGTDLDTVQSKIQKLLPGPKLRYETSNAKDESGASNSLWIFHESHFKAEEPLGFIAAYAVPTNMSVQNVTEARLGQHRAA